MPPLWLRPASLLVREWLSSIELSATAQDFFANCHADAFLKFEAHQTARCDRKRSAALSTSPCSECFDDFNENLRVREAGHGASRTSHQLFK